MSLRVGSRGYLTCKGGNLSMISRDEIEVEASVKNVSALRKQDSEPYKASAIIRTQDGNAALLYEFLRVGLRYRVTLERIYDEALSPCPFCGDNARYEEGDGCAVCEGCGASTRTGLREPVAADAWNNRLDNEGGGKGDE